MNTESSRVMSRGLGILLNVVAVLAIIAGLSVLYMTFLLARSSYTDYLLAFCGIFPIVGGVALLAKKPFGWWFTLINAILLCLILFLTMLTRELDAPGERAPLWWHLTQLGLSLASVIVLLLGKPWTWSKRQKGLSE